MGTHTGSDCLSGDGDMEYREYRDVFYANRCPDQQSQRGDFLLKTEELFPARCLFRFQSGAGPFFTSSSKRNRLPEALGGRQTGKSLTQNDAKLLFKGIQQNWTRDDGG